jgi:hypothetical protein
MQPRIRLPEHCCGCDLPKPARQSVPRAIAHIRDVFLLPAFGILLSGCVARTIEPVGAIVPADGSPTLNWTDWGLILDRAVVNNTVDYSKVLEDRRPLDQVLAMTSRVGPQTTPAQFPTSNHRLAYSINCYNATIVRSVLELAHDGKLPSYLPSDLETRFRFRIDGRLQTPADLRREAITLAGDDWRVRFVLCDGSMSGPPLQRRVFLGDLLDAQLNRATQAAFVAPEVVKIDHCEKKLVLWRGLYESKNHLIREYERRTNAKEATILNALCDWADRPRREALGCAVGYDVVLMPTDRRPNSVDAVPAAQGTGIFSAIDSIYFLRPE